MSSFQGAQPGPWRETAGHVHDEHGSVIAVVMAHDTPVGAANARLIKAAPKLLTALLKLKRDGNNFAEWHEKFHPAIAAIDEALFEATGDQT